MKIAAIVFSLLLVLPRLLSAQSGAFPDRTWVPAEFQKTMGVLVAWPYPASAQDPYARIWGQVIEAASREGLVYVKLQNKGDSTQVINYLSANNLSYVNGRVKYFARKGDNLWMRDYGPLFFYGGASDTLSILDLNTGDADPFVEDFPAFFAQFVLNVPFYKNPIRLSGGQFLSDGFGRLLTSDLVPQANANNPDSVHVTPWAETETADTLKKIFNHDKYTELQSLSCDGGGGNLNLSIKYLNESLALAVEYPSAVNTPDNDATANNAALLSAIRDPYEQKLKVVRLPLPTSDNGAYLNSSCAAQNDEYRTYLGGLMLNKTYLTPIFSDTSTGNWLQDSTVIALLKQNLPGYNVIPIDCRALALESRSLNSLALPIPAKNPFRFWHVPVTGVRPYTAIPIRLVARVYNHDSVETVTAYFKPRVDTATWQAISLVDSAGWFVGQIPFLAFQPGDKIDYYLTATAGGGEAFKPYNAPQGFYTFEYNPFVSVENLSKNAPSLNLYPNPAAETAFAALQLDRPQTLTLALTNAMGQEVYRQNLRLAEGSHTLPLPLQNLPNGVYALRAQINGQTADTKKLIVRR